MPFSCMTCGAAGDAVDPAARSQSRKSRGGAQAQEPEGSGTQPLSSTPGEGAAP